MHAGRTALFGLLLAAAALAHAGSASLQVSAVVAPRVSAVVEDSPRVIQVAAADVTRGYVDFDAPVVIHLRSNLAHAFVLQMQSDTSAVARIEARTLAGPAQPTAGGLLVPPAAGQRQIVVRLRFVLAPDTAPGHYPWPLRLAGTA
ncbi:hypothetical protein [Ramlibacter sp.]|uniref:hypothetical protein n=1 Tax=Ramlibacter sp. TaxID=1917967 RepID=UPI002FC98EDC